MKGTGIYFFNTAFRLVSINSASIELVNEEEKPF